MEFLVEFIKENLSLVHLDLAGTGLDEDGIYELVELLKQYQDGKQTGGDAFKLRNLACVHFTCFDKI